MYYIATELKIKSIMKTQDLIKMFRYEYGFEHHRVSNLKKHGYLKTPIFLWVTSQVIKTFYNKTICFIKGHDIRYEGNEPDLENGPSENDFYCYCNRCYK